MKLWFALRDRRLNGFKFVRQEAIGSYIVDFVCREAKLVIEVDGGQHADSRSDDARDAALSAEGYRVLRLWNSDVLTNPEGVLNVILARLQGLESRTTMPLTRPSLRSGHPLPLRGARVAHRVRGAALQDEDYGANMRACTSDAASSMVMNTAPSASSSAIRFSSANMR